VRSPSSLVRETTETESQDYGYKFRQEEETYNKVREKGWKPNKKVRNLAKWV
jgi:hypothetical protein